MRAQAARSRRPSQATSDRHSKPRCSAKAARSIVQHFGLIGTVVEAHLPEDLLGARVGAVKRVADGAVHPAAPGEGLGPLVGPQSGHVAVDAAALLGVVGALGPGGEVGF